MSVHARRKGRLNCLHREEQLELIGRKGNEPKALIELFGLLIFRIYEKADPAGEVEYLDELLHCRNHQNVPDALPLELVGASQSSKSDTGYVSW